MSTCKLGKVLAGITMLFSRILTYLSFKKGGGIRIIDAILVFLRDLSASRCKSPLTPPPLFTDSPQPCVTLIQTMFSSVSYRRAGGGRGVASSEKPSAAPRGGGGGGHLYPRRANAPTSSSIAGRVANTTASSRRGIKSFLRL